MANKVLEYMTVGSTTLASMYNITCSTAASTAAKTATADPAFALFSGVRLRVTFTNENTAASPTLNVNSTGAVAIVADGSNAATSGTWNAGAVVDLIYNGTSYVIVGGGTVTPVTQNVETSLATVLSSMVAPSGGLSIGQYVVVNGVLYRATTNIGAGEALTPGTNVVATNVGGDIVSYLPSLFAPAGLGVGDVIKRLVNVLGTNPDLNNVPECGTYAFALTDNPLHVPVGTTCTGFVSTYSYNPLATSSNVFQIAYIIATTINGNTKVGPGIYCRVRRSGVWEDWVGILTIT